MEALVNAAYELDIWLKKEENYLLFDGPENLEHCPLGVLETAAALHFPQLVPPADALSLAVKSYRNWLIDGRQERLEKGLPSVSPDHMKKLLDFYDPFIRARNALIDSAKSAARELAVP